MKISYKREMKHNYMIIDPETEGAAGFESDMLEGNHIEGLLKFQVRHIDNRKYYCYEITSRQPLSRLFEHKNMGLNEIRTLIFGIAHTLDHMEAYLLGEEQILLKPDYIYTDPDSLEMMFCLVPGSRYDFLEDLTELLRYLLGKVDHQDKEAVVAAYGLYQESQKDNYSLESLLNVLGNSRAPALSAETEGEERGAVVLNGEREANWKEEEWGHADRGMIEPIKENEFVRPGPAHLVLPLAVFFGGPVLLWFLQGTEGLTRNFMWLAAADILAVAASVLPAVFKRSGGEEEPKRQQDSEASQAWKLSLEQEGEESSEDEVCENPAGTVPEYKSSDTVLLRDLDETTEVRRLVSLDKQTEDIPIPYFPFIIGKQGDLVDYVLDKNTVSRLHLRIDHNDLSYQFTDLNTTNGTRVRGHMLEANEAASVMPGDEVYIADVGYLFL